jgi:hypothetical protein
VKLRAATPLSAMHILDVAADAERAQNRFACRSRSTRGLAMNLHKPSKIVFLIAVTLAVLALCGFFLSVPVITQYHFWFALAGFLLLALGCIL